MSHIIGIGGCSRSGKSSLARQIKEKLLEKKVLLLDMDDFVFPESEIPKIKDRTDWECPESIDYQKLVQPIHASVRDFDTIVIEGILAFANDELLSLMDTTIQMEISKDTFLERRRLETRWGDEPEWFLEHVWESHIKHGQYPKADFIVSGEAKITQQSILEILKKINP